MSNHSVKGKGWGGMVGPRCRAQLVPHRRWGVMGPHVHRSQMSLGPMRKMDLQEAGQVVRMQVGTKAVATAHAPGKPCQVSG